VIREQLDLFDTKYDLIDNKVDEFFWAYHAGMADGDGCFKFNKKSLCYSLNLIDKNIIEAGAATLDKKVANFAKDNNFFSVL